MIARTRGGGWPTQPVTDADNFVDLVWHGLEFRDGYSFTSAVYDAPGTYLGCCYLYPLGRRSRAMRHTHSLTMTSTSADG